MYRKPKRLHANFFMLLFICMNFLHHGSSTPARDYLKDLFKNFGPNSSPPYSTESEEEREALQTESIDIDTNYTTDGPSEQTTLFHSLPEVQANTTLAETDLELDEIFSSSSNEQSSNFSMNSTHQTHSSVSSVTDLSLNESSNSTHAKVLLGNEHPILFPRTLIQKTIEWMNDTYALSIALPIAAGIVFASTIILTLTICNCLKRRCRSKRIRRIALHTTKNSRHSDRTRLLADPSDEEF